MPLPRDWACAEISRTVMKKNLDSIKARRHPHGQLIRHKGELHKVASADEPGFEYLETNRVKLYIKTKHPDGKEDLISHS